jgi:antirestriction protein
MNSIQTPEIYIACLASYINAILHGKWIPVTDENSVLNQIHEMLHTSPIEGAEEFAIHDC